jgi:hypothetical protein
VLTSIHVPGSVEIIGGQCFGECRSLVSVEFAQDSKLAQLGDFAFQNCVSLTSISIPGQVGAIGQWCFAQCSRLTEIVFASGSILSRIKYGAFLGCSSLRSICLPAFVEVLSADCFRECKNLIVVTCDAGSKLSVIESRAFGGCSSLRTAACSSVIRRHLQLDPEHRQADCLPAEWIVDALPGMQLVDRAFSGGEEFMNGYCAFLCDCFCNSLD